MHEGQVIGVAFSPDGRALAAAFFDPGLDPQKSGVILWDPAVPHRLANVPLAAGEGGILCLAFSPDGKALATGGGGFGRDGAGGGVALWDLATRKPLAGGRLTVSEGRVNRVAFSPDGKTLAIAYSGAQRDGVVLRDVVTHKRLADLPIPVSERGAVSVAFSPDGRTLAAGFGSMGRFGGPAEVGGVMLWDAATHERLADKLLPVSEGSVWGVAFSPDGKTLAAAFGPTNVDGGRVGGVALWDVATRKRLADGPFAVMEGKVECVAFSPDGKTLAAGVIGPATAGGVMLWDVATRKPLADKPLTVNRGFVTGGLAFSPDGKTLAAGVSADVALRGVMLWDVAGFGGGILLWDEAALERQAAIPAEPQP